MLERLFRKREWFEQVGAIEILVEEGRTPAFLPAGSGKEERVLVVIPPSGVNASIDEYEVRPGGAWEFFAPDGGTSKGISELYDVSPRVGDKLKQRRDSALQIVANRQPA